MSGKGLRGMRATKCPHCGGMRLVGVAERPEDSAHALRAASPAVVAKWPKAWPTCGHGVVWPTDCRDVPVPPPCCPRLKTESQ